MRTLRLGQGGPEVSALGVGCSRMSTPPRDDEESIATLHAAMEAGLTFLNTADFYGMGHNEMLIGRAIKGRREQAFLSVKCGTMLSPTGAFLGLDGRPNAIKAFAAYSLQRLGVEVIDLYQAGRPDPAVPYEETIGAIADLIQDGKVRYLGVSEVGAETLRRAHAVHPVAALEIEYSLACRFIEAEILPAAREIGAAVVAYRTLADGLLSGAVTEEPTTGAVHLTPPRLKGDNLRHNVRTMGALKAMGVDKGATPAQLAIAWLCTRGNDILPLVGMRRRTRLKETLDTLDVSFTAAELAELDQAFGPEAIRGERYPAFVLKYAAS